MRSVVAELPVGFVCISIPDMLFYVLVNSAVLMGPVEMVVELRERRRRGKSCVLNWLPY
jgi:hypothetical protein